jgi:hypothetical protein
MMEKQIKQRERETERERQTQRETERECVCVCVYNILSISPETLSVKMRLTKLECFTNEIEDRSLIMEVLTGAYISGAPSGSLSQNTRLE